jgi:hypothetical protein
MLAIAPTDTSKPSRIQVMSSPFIMSQRLQDGRPNRRG